MPSVKNPNGPSKNRLAARAAKARDKSQKQKNSSKKNRVQKADSTRGARDGLLPTSGPNAALSAKKRRKLERKMGYVVKRQMKADGEVEMKDVSEEKNDQAAVDEQMAVDMEGI